MTYSTGLSDRLEVKVQRIATVRPMSLMGQKRTSEHVQSMSALFPRKQTLIDARDMSALCQKQTYAVQQIAAYSISSDGGGRVDR